MLTDLIRLGFDLIDVYSLAMHELVNGKCEKCPKHSTSVAGGKCNCISNNLPPVNDRCVPW